MSRVVQVQSDVNANTPFFAPLGSGGGTGGAYTPNPSFSTITFPASDQTTKGCINYSSILSFRDSSTPVKNTFYLLNGLGGVVGTASDITAMQLNSPAGTTATTYIGAGNDGTTYITATNTTNTRAPLTITASGVNMDALNVSSINGAAPGGSPSPNPVFSSITTGSLSTVSLLADNMNISSITVSSINGAPPGGGVLSANPSFSSITLAPGGGGNGAINISTAMFVNGIGGGSNSSYVFQPNTDILGGVRNVLTFRAPNTKDTQMLISHGDDTISRIDCTGGSLLTGTLAIYALTSISSLNVSSINGTAVVGASDMSTLQGQMVEVRSTLGLV